MPDDDITNGHGFRWRIQRLEEDIRKLESNTMSREVIQARLAEVASDIEELKEKDKSRMRLIAGTIAAFIGKLVYDLFVAGVTPGGP